MSALHQSLIDTVREMNRAGINQGTAGNASVRLDADRLLITPSGMPYDTLSVESLVVLRMDGTHDCPQGHRPSSEWRFHRDLLAARDDLDAVVHTHGIAASGLAAHARTLPAFHYMIAVGGGNDIRCADYATFGTQALSDHVIAAMADRKACLLAHHGLVTGGRTLAQALAVAVEVEALCKMYLAALAIGEPPVLSAEQMEAVHRQFGQGIGAGPAFAPYAAPDAEAEAR